MTNLEIINLQPLTDCNQTFCQCESKGPGATQFHELSQRWFITMGHPGFNAKNNQVVGFATDKVARSLIGHFAAKGKAHRGEA